MFEYLSHRQHKCTYERCFKDLIRSLSVKYVFLQHTLTLTSSISADAQEMEEGERNDEAKATKEVIATQQSMLKFY